MSALDHFSASHFDWQCVAGIGTIRLNRPERKNPLTFESYAELKNLFHYVAQQDTIKTIVILPNGGNFCSGGDVHDIIGPLLDKDTKGLFQFTRICRSRQVSPGAGNCTERARYRGRRRRNAPLRQPVRTPRLIPGTAPPAPLRWRGKPRAR